MKRKGGWRVGHASRESREGSREIVMQLEILRKKRRAKFSALTESVMAEHVFLPVWLEEVSVVGIPRVYLTATSLSGPSFLSVIQSVGIVAQ